MGGFDFMTTFDSKRGLITGVKDGSSLSLWIKVKTKSEQHASMYGMNPGGIYGQHMKSTYPPNMRMIMIILQDNKYLER